MTKTYIQIRSFLFLISLLFLGISIIDGQELNDTLHGIVLESGSGIPLKQSIVSIISTGEYTITDENGVFSILLPRKNERIKINLPGYHTSSFIANDQKETVIYLTKHIYISDDATYSNPIEEYVLKNTNSAVSLLLKKEFDKTCATTFDQAMNSKVAGMRVIEHSGMPGHSTWINIRGISSVYSKNEPVVFIDGMIHETRYPINSLIDGYMLNPMELIDIDDIVNVTVIKTGESHLGSAGSNGIIYVNTEQSKETSSAINFKISGGLALTPSKLDVMDAGQYKNYFTNMLSSQGYSSSEINTMYPWLNGDPESSVEYYRYNNNTDWQKENFKMSSYQKYHFYLKGGDDIATYNISTGYLRQGGSYNNWRYSRYNLRGNGKINITNRFSVIPNTKLSLSDTYLSNMGPNTSINPVLAGLLNPPLAGPHERTRYGTELTHFDDVGVFNTSNPTAIIENSLGTCRNVHLISSVKAIFNINSKLAISNLIGINFNNDRESIFIPDIGVAHTGLVRNSPRDMVTEFRSTQNFTTITYKNIYNNVHLVNINAGLRYMSNTYKNNLAIDYNTPTDDFRSLGKGSGFEYLRVSDGEVNGLKWLSYFGQINYNFLDKYYLSSSVSFDGCSALNENNRYNIYPSLYAAWRITENQQWLDDLKMRASWDLSGNMFSSIYDFSKLFYTGRRYNNVGVIIRDYNPNYDLKMEKKSTINIGFDLSMKKKAINLQADYYLSNVNNLIINQQLPYNYGFTNYYDNGGKMYNSGIELSFNSRKHHNNMTIIIDATIATQLNRVSKLNFIDSETSFLITNVYGAEYITSEKNPINAFYGYKTNGIYQSNAEANGIIGPNGWEMGAGDVIFEDVDGNNIINDNDKQIIGNPNPAFFGGFSASVSYKTYEFEAIFNYSVGNDIYNYVRYQMTAMQNYANQSPDVLDSWKSNNTNASLPKATYGDPVGNNVFSDRWIEDGSYLRLKELKISKELEKFQKSGKEIIIYLSASNIFTLTKYSGYDPETMYLNHPFFLGLDYGKIPHVRNIIIGVNLGL
ncbi:MAG: SusC/RagA family TonB-linked outer membrane protein [Bacteroidales bacterium]|nr:SusC/RagA family TonB-linked outer membrane protein [Bacteroidales bacterium]